LKNVNFILFYKVVFSFADTTTAWIRRNRDTELVKSSAAVFKKAENQLDRAITSDRKQMGLKYKMIIT
jgi:hypothetical protein